MKQFIMALNKEDMWFRCLSSTFSNLSNAKHTKAFLLGNIHKYTQVKVRFRVFLKKMHGQNFKLLLNFFKTIIKVSGEGRIKTLNYVNHSLQLKRFLNWQTSNRCAFIRVAQYRCFEIIFNLTENVKKLTVLCYAPWFSRFKFIWFLFMGSHETISLCKFRQ